MQLFWLMPVFMYKIAFICTTLRNSKSTVAWMPSAAIGPVGPDTFCDQRCDHQETNQPLK